MRSTRLLLPVSVLSLSTSCDLASPPGLPTTPDVPTVPASAVSLVLIEPGTEFFVGMQVTVVVTASDVTGRLTHSDRAQITSSDPAVITLAAPHVGTTGVIDGSSVRGIRQTITMVGAGTAIVRASLDGASDSVVLKVAPLPPVSAALVIDSFTVIEYRARCQWDCPTLLYAPLLKLREPTGTSPVDVLAIQFDFSSTSTGLCTARDLRLSAGFAGHMIHIYDSQNIYDDNHGSDMVYVEPNGVLLPEGSVKARVIFRDSRGVAGMVEARGAIQRMVSNPEFPASPFAGTSWWCSSRWEDSR